TAADATATDDVAGDGGATTPEVATKDSFVVLVADRVPARVRSLAAVHAQVEQAVVAQKRQAERTAWLADKRAQIDVIETANPALVLPTDSLPGAAAPDGAAPEGAEPTEAPSTTN